MMRLEVMVETRGVVVKQRMDSTQTVTSTSPISLLPSVLGDVEFTSDPDPYHPVWIQYRPPSPAPGCTCDLAGILIDCNVEQAVSK